MIVEASLNRVHPSFAKKTLSSVSRKAHVDYKRAFRLALRIYENGMHPPQSEKLESFRFSLTKNPIW